MRWRRLGRLFAGDGAGGWTHSHGIVGIPRPLGGPLWRIHFSPRDGQGRSNLSWLDISLREPGRVLRRSARPLLEPGRPGCFDEAGAMGACIVEAGGEERLYYQGFSRPRSVPFHAAIGLAVRPAGDPGRPFARVGEGPLLDRCREEPFFVANPAVRPDGQGGWRMWYQSGRPWAGAEGAWLPRYDIREAWSADGLDWRPLPGRALPFAHPGEVAIARFWPLREADGRWRAFYSFRGDAWPYRMGTATSPDGHCWTREDGAMAMAVEPGGWERLSLHYPTVFDAEGARWMLYSAGRYGDAGLGLAMLEQD